MYSYACIQYGTLYRTRASCCPGSGSCIGYVHYDIIIILKMYNYVYTDT